MNERNKIIENGKGTEIYKNGNEKKKGDEKNGNKNE